MFYFDSHNHLCNCEYPHFEEEYFCLANFCTEEEWNNFIHHEKKNILKSFGIHPQMFASTNFSECDYERKIEFLENLLKKNEIFAIGEIGFDFFTEEFKNTKEIQEKYWKIQIELAKKYSKPIVIHARKAMDKIFSYSTELKNLPFVIFHSFAGTKMDAKSLLNKKINAFFSFGKHQIFNEKKSSIQMLKSYAEFPNRIFLETDAPYQTLKNEAKTSTDEIKLVYEKANSICNIDFFEITKNAFEKLIMEM